MITLDTSTLNDAKDEVYSVDKGSRGKLMRDGVEVKSCVYANITQGVAICTKRDMSGNIMVADGNIVHELVFGSFVFEPFDKD